MSNTRVAVSGITGYIGAYVTASLLRKGYTVHGTLRKNTPEKIAHLPTDTPGTLKVFEADLLTPDSFDEATKDCKYALHIASPYKLEVKDPQTELVDPAVKGTLSFLGSCVKNGVEKVVLTSSLAAICDGGVPGKVFDESDWNTHSSVKFLPYFYSKAEAERQAWRFAEEHSLNLVAINPVGVYGPSMTSSINESPGLIVQLLSGKFPALFDLSFAVVDVRDVAEAHIRAMESDTASGRYLCCTPDPMLHMRDFVRLIQQEGFDLSLRDMTSPFVSKVLRFLSKFGSGTQMQFTNRLIANPMVPTSAKMVKDLDMKFIPAEKSITDTIRDLEKWGHIKKQESA